MPKKIFIVDDDSFLLDMYALKFSQSGFDVATALGAVPALEKLHADTAYKPDIILLDIVMPIVDGFEFMEGLDEFRPKHFRQIWSSDNSVIVLGGN